MTSGRRNSRTAVVFNCGSATVKFAVVMRSHDGVLTRLVEGVVDGIGGDGPLQLFMGDQRLTADVSGDSTQATAIELVNAALSRVGSALTQPFPDVIGHRVVHGGDALTAAVVIDRDVERTIESFAPLAPLHNPASLVAIRSAERIFPGIRQVAVFDTAFHASLPLAARSYAVPARLATMYPLRRFGFHGISCASALEATAAYLGRAAQTLNLIICHLGGGASVTAIRRGRSIDTSMGMTPLEGLVMATRSGDVDPALIPYLVGSTGMNADEVLDMLTTQSGMLGLCGDSDMRSVRQRASEGDQSARDALTLYGHRLRHYIGAYVAQLAEIDALVFTGGVGEHDAQVRQEVVQPLAHLGFVLDESLNARAGSDRVRPIGRNEPARPAVLVVPADEDLQIAREALAVIDSREG